MRSGVTYQYLSLTSPSLMSRAFSEDGATVRIFCLFAITLGSSLLCG
jgi:hypothetical protein